MNHQVGWRLRIEHVTRVRYAGPVRSSFNEARMTPLTLPSQTTLESQVTVGSGDIPVWSYDDYWGTHVSVFEVPQAHEDLLIRATSTVATGSCPRLPPARQRPDWAAIRDRAERGRLLEMTLPTALTALDPQVCRAVVAEVAGRGPDEAAAAIAALVRERITYRPGATGAQTSASQAWDNGQGVCQDLAQVTVGLLRAAGLPARYVSGYLHPRASPKPGRTVIGPGHAWAEYWAGSWTPLDPTTGSPVGERHVVVARGRDYGDVPPLKGTYDGPPPRHMDVTVELTRLA
ncbi:MAG TPA: transglutaminase family protein [Trebonia sp.]|nr:transglutaminase family protein [Trebonia sp.]